MNLMGRHTSWVLFTRVRGIGILRNWYSASWIRSRNTPPRLPRSASHHLAGGRYYLRLDAYAGFWIRVLLGPEARVADDVSSAVFIYPDVYESRARAVLAGDL